MKLANHLLEGHSHYDRFMTNARPDCDYEGTIWSNLESPRDFVPRDMTADQAHRRWMPALAPTFDSELGS